MKINLGGTTYNVVLEGGDIACIITVDDPGEKGSVSAVVQRDEKKVYGIVTVNDGLGEDVLPGAESVAQIVGQLLINNSFSIHTGMFFHVRSVIEMACVVNAIKKRFGDGVRFNNIPEEFPCVVMYTVSFYPVAGPVCEFSWIPDNNVRQLMED